MTNNINALTTNELKEFGISATEYKLLTDQIAPGATPAELRLFLYTAKQTGLNPFKRQIYLIARKVKTPDGYKIVRTPQTSIDGLRAIAARSGQYAGSSDARFDDEAKPRKATIAVWRLVGGQRCQFDASARWEQYYPGSDGWLPGQPAPTQPDPKGFMWRKMPHMMLGKVAEALALRKAFPEDLSGLYTDDEMAQANAVEVRPTNNEPTNSNGTTKSMPLEEVVIQPLGETIDSSAIKNSKLNLNPTPAAPIEYATIGQKKLLITLLHDKKSITEAEVPSYLEQVEKLPMPLRAKDCNDLIKRLTSLPANKN